MSKRVFEEVPIDSIICPEQVRKYFDEEAQAGLDMTVRERGIQVPVALYRRDGKLYLKDGARRIRAAKAAGLNTVPAIIEEREISDGDAILEPVILNCQRADLTPPEKAKAIAAAMKITGFSATQIAAKLGVANSTVTKLLSVLSLSESLQRQIRTGKLPRTAAYALTQVTDVAEQNKLAGQVVNGELTRDGLSGAIKSRNRNGRPKKAASRRRACVQARLPGRQSMTVSAPNLDLNSFIAIVETVLTHAKAAQLEGLTLDALLRRLRHLSPEVPSATATPLPALPGQTEGGSDRSEFKQAV